MTISASSPPLHVLRSILRLLKTTTSNGSRSLNPTQAYVLSQYRANQFVPQQRATALHQVAYNYYALKRDLTERAVLYEMDSGAEVKLSPKEQSRRAAARAGLQLPKEVVHHEEK